MIKIYHYKACDTCRRALKFLKENNLEFVEIPIVESPPSEDELRRMRGHLQNRGEGLRRLFNTSGQVYRELNLTQKLADGLSEDEAIKLLAANGKLIKRPFVLSEQTGTVGFDAREWRELFEKAGPPRL